MTTRDQGLAGGAPATNEREDAATPKAPRPKRALPTPSQTHRAPPAAESGPRVKDRAGAEPVDGPLAAEPVLVAIAPANDSSSPPPDRVAPPPKVPPPRAMAASLGLARLGRCELFVEIARGGMATVHLGRWHGAGGFSKTVAVKRLHAQFASDPSFVRMLLDEARVVSRIRHPNVTSTIDVLESAGEIFIVMDYVHTVTLAQLVRQSASARWRLPVAIALRVIHGMLQGLHAAHEATDERGERLNVIHRDVSPENVIVAVDGHAHLIDFGVAQALGRLTHSREGEVKGKIRYLAPEQLLGDTINAQTDVFSAAIVLWQLLCGRHLFRGDNPGAISHAILGLDPPDPSTINRSTAPCRRSSIASCAEAWRAIAATAGRAPPTWPTPSSAVRRWPRTARWASGSSAWAPSASRS
jgi:serine/threonine protein kinase